MWRMRIVIACIFLFSSLASPCLGTDVISKADLRKKVRVTNLFYNDLNPPLKTDDFVMKRMEDGAPFVEGVDQSLKGWRATLPSTMRGLWLADLYGARTYYFAGYTGVSGMAPSAWILVLTFDNQRRPVPFYITTRDTDYDKSGIKGLLNLDGQGPQLLQQEWKEVNWREDALSGYFITTLYQLRGPYWYRSDRRHGEKKYPIFQRWAMVPKMQPEMVDSSSLPELPISDYGNDPVAGFQTRIGGLDNRRIHLNPTLDCALQSWNVVVLDSPAGRDIEVGDFHTRRYGKLLPLVSRDRLFVSLAGIKREGPDSHCSASIIWATNDPNGTNNGPNGQ